MAHTRLELLNRVTSLCAGEPFRWTLAITPFDFDHQPSGNIDQVFRIEVQDQGTIGGLNYSEDRTDIFSVWVARKQNAAPHDAYGLLVTDVTSLTSAVVHDGATGGGDYAVIDNGGVAGVAIEHAKDRDYAVARIALPINYESQL